MCLYRGRTGERCAKTAEPIVTREPVWGHLVWGKEPCVRCGPEAPGKWALFGAHVINRSNVPLEDFIAYSPQRVVTGVQRRCDLLPSYFGHLFDIRKNLVF